MGRKDKVIMLINTTNDVNKAGDTITAPLDRQVYAEKKSIRQTEFYQAAATGLRPELTFVIWTREYGGEKKLKYNGKTYEIIRTFEPDDENIELVCSGIVNKGQSQQ